MKKDRKPKKSSPPLKDMTLEEAEKIIYEQIKAGKNYRDILKMTLIVDGEIMPLNPKKIHAIKEKFEQNGRTTKRDPDTALAFKLMDEGLSDVEIVKQTELPYEFVRKARQQWLGCYDKIEVPKSVMNNLFEILRLDSKSKNYEELLKQVKRVKDDSNDLERFSPPCLECGLPMIFSFEIWDEAARWIQQNQQCTSDKCRNRGQRTNVAIIAT